MVSFLIAYGSDEGQTATVAEYIETVLTDRGHDVTTRDVTEASDALVDDADAMLVGSPKSGSSPDSSASYTGSSAGNRFDSSD